MSGFFIEKKREKYNSVGLDIIRISIIHIALQILSVAFSGSLSMAFFTGESLVLAPFVVVLSYLIFSSKSWINGKIEQKKWMLCRGLLFFIAIIFVLYFVLQDLTQGLEYFENGYFRLFEEHDFLWNIVYLNGEMSSVTGLILFGLFLLAALEIVLLEKRKGLILLVVIHISPLILALGTNHVPAFPYVLCSIGSLVMLLIWQWDNKVIPLIKNEVMAGILFTAMIGCSIFSGTIIDDYKSDNNEQYSRIRTGLKKLETLNVQNFVDDVQGGNYATEGVGKGNLSGLRRNNPSKSEVAKVVLFEKPKDTVYLKSFVASEYSPEQWNLLQGKGLEKLENLIETYAESETYFYEESVIEEIKGRAVNKLIVFENLQGEGLVTNIISNGKYNELREDTMYIFRKTKRRDLTFIPYFNLMEVGYNYNSELFEESEGSDDYSYDYFPLNQVELFTEENIDTTTFETGDFSASDIEFYRDEDVRQMLESSSDTEIQTAYRKFLEEYYVKYPQNLKALNELINELNERKASGEWQGVEAEIENLFSQGFRYTLNPGKTPGNEDFIEHFLEQKRGFCVHFATAATMLYRAMTIPARYVEGYAIPADEFKYDSESDNYVAVVTDEMAHAWCETYDKNMGWMPKDHTPGQQTGGGVEEKTTQKERVTIPEITTKREEKELQTTKVEMPTNEPTDNSQTKQVVKDKAGKNKPVYPVKMIFGLLFLAGGLVTQYWVRIKNKKIKFKKKKNNLGMRYMVQELFRICRVAGIDVEHCTEKEAFIKMKENLSELQEEEWAWIYEKGLIATFSQERLNREEYVEMQRLLNKLKKEVWKKLNPLKKLAYKIIYAL